MRPVPGFEGRYSVTDAGQVWSHLTHRFLALASDNQGYLRVTLMHASGERQQRGVHQIVARAFLGRMPRGATLVRHLDDNKANNHVSNLAYGTVADNLGDRRRNGRDSRLNRTECLQGHPYDAANTYRSPSGARVCRSCNRAAQKRLAAKRAEAHR